MKNWRNAPINPESTVRVAAVRQVTAEMVQRGDLVGLGTVAELSLVALRQLCDQPTGCAELDDCLRSLRALPLDHWQDDQNEQD